MASINISNGEHAAHSGNNINGSRTPSTFMPNSGRSLFGHSYLLSNGDARNEDSNHTGPISNGVIHGEEPSDDDSTDSNEPASVDGFRQRAVSRVFPVPAHAWMHHGHAHPHENENNRRIRIPDGRQCFTVVLNVRFRDAQIAYSRTFASMSSMTPTPAHNMGLHADDLEHLYRLISIRFKHFVTCLDPVTQRPLLPNGDPALSCYTAEVSLSAGENPVRFRGVDSFHNYGRSTLAPADARYITCELEEIVLSAVETIDDLSDYRLSKHLAADYDRQSIIPEFEARRAFEQERTYQRRIAQLESRLRDRARERGGGGGGGLEWDPLRTRAEAFRPRSGGSHTPAASAADAATW